MDEASPPVSVPRLRTARLLLREFRQSDFDTFAANAADPEATRFTHGPVDRRTAWRLFAAATGNWMLQGIGWWAVDRADGGGLAGTVGLFHRDGFTELEIGWTVLRPFWRQGIASEAASEALRHARLALHADRVIAFIAPDNEASIGVARRLDMRFEEEIPVYGGRWGRWAAA